MFSTLNRFLTPFLSRNNQRAQRQDDLKRECKADAVEHSKDQSCASPDWQTLTRAEPVAQTESKRNTVARRSQRLWNVTKSQLKFKNRLEYEVEADISKGREANKIPAFSYKRRDKAPNDFHYVTEYVQYHDVQLNETLKIMSYCECQGDCNDGRCACSSNHRTGRCYNSKGILNSAYNVDSPHVIHECNAGCSCNRKQCKNMVIQRGSQAKLVLFRTRSRGWGVRCLENLQRGTFIGVYSGELISAEASRQREDDTYLFNLANSQIIYTQANGTAEQVSGKPDSAYQEEQSSIVIESGNEPALVEETSISDEYEVNSSNGAEQNPQNEENKMEQDESQPTDGQFVCDAKFYGNFTRFINHSCEPNVIGIRSFTRHHDLRFPYISFFTNKEIPANTELTLNYGDNYWVVKCRRDKVFCLCHRPSCRFNRKTFAPSQKK